MTIDRDNLLESIMQSLDRIPDIPLGELPNIDLYMDQLTTFMDKELGHTTRFPGEDSVLTKTMINNYAKNDLLPPPVRKKYSRDHMILLIFIYCYKNILSMNDIQKLLEPLKERFHISDTESMTLSDIYSEIFEIGDRILPDTREDIKKKFDIAEKTFDDAPEECRDRMKLFSFITLLGFDVYVKKLLIEKIIDSFPDEQGDSSERKKRKKKGQKQVK